MNASIKIGVMALMALSIFSSVALADPTLSGGDAGNSASQASPLESAIPLNSWSVYLHGYVYPGTDPDDWYQLNTQNGEYLNYQLDIDDYDIAEQKIRDSADTTTLGPINAGKTYLPVTGATKSWDHVKGTDSQNPEYEFALKRTTT